MKKDFYKILGVNQGADPATIKKAYRRAAKRYHPDVSPKDEQRFKEVQEAYETLSDPQKKVLYDQEFLEKPVSKPPIYSFRKSSRFNFFDEINQFFGWDDLSELFGEAQESPPALSAEIALSPEEARKGCEILLNVPLWATCSRCRGTGRIGNLICGLCRGRGEEKKEKRIRVKLPPGLRDGMKIRIPLGDRKWSGVDLIATISVPKC